MCSRIFRTLITIDWNRISRSQNFTRFFNVSEKLNTPRVGQYDINNFITIRLCSTSVHIKDEIAQTKIDEFLKNPKNLKHYKVLELEIDIMRQSGGPAPEVLKPRHWIELLNLKSISQRRRYLSFLFKIEKKKENIVEKKKVRNETRLQKMANDNPTDLDYTLTKNSLFLRIYDTTINNMYNWKLMRAMMFGQKLIFDCGYEHEMNSREIRYCARQMQFAFAANRSHDDPFDLHYCNFNPKGNLYTEFYSTIPTMHEPEFPINVTDKSYLDMFDKNSLVYLTPHCNQFLDKFDSDSIYIVGAIVDKADSRPLSLAKAKREGLRMAKLPIDRYLDFGCGSGKCLTLNQMVTILADLQLTGDWTYALRHVPKRKLMPYTQYRQEKKLTKMRQTHSNYYNQSSSPTQDFSIQSRNKFRNNL